MGFFSDLRDDLSQAVNELMPGEETKKQAAEDKYPSGKSSGMAVNGRGDASEEERDGGYDADLSRMLEQMDEIEVPEIVEEMPAPPAAQKDEEEKEVKEIREETRGRALEIVSEGEVAVLTGNTVINGNIAAKEDLEVRGSIVGNVEASGRLTVSGAIKGDSKAAEISVDGARIDGELRSSGKIKVGPSSVIIGNIFAESGMIAGAVRGDIDVKESLMLGSSAVVLGNIKSKSLQINKGAILEGMCSQCYSEVNPSSFFEEDMEEK